MTDPQSVEYKCTPDAFWGMTGPQFVIRVQPNALRLRYGKPIDDRDRESLGTYVFSARSGAVVTVYYRANDMWSLLLRLARPAFWRSKTPVDLTIGAQTVDDGRAFALWLSRELGAPVRPWA